MPGSTRSPENTRVKSGEVQAAESRSMSAAVSGEYATSCGATGRTGATRE